MHLLQRFRDRPPFGVARCRIPSDLESVASRGEEVAPGEVGSSREAIDGLWGKVEALYRSGAHPAIQICIRRSGQVVLHGAIGHASGNAPGDAPDAPKRVVQLDTPINLFSASKAVTAMVVHKLAERRVLHLDDWVSDFIPDFARHGKNRITIRHVLAHRAGVPNLPPDAIDLDLLGKPDQVLELLCDAELQSRPGRLLAYHAVTGGFILGEVVERVTGKSLREVLREEIADPLGLQWLNYGVTPEQVGEVALNACTGPSPPPPLAQILRRALGADLRDVVELSNDPRFLTGVIPSANVMTTALEINTFYQCLLDGGEHEGKQVFDARTIRHATAEQSWWEVDFTLLYPLRYGLGFMLGSKRVGPFGRDNPYAFGHIGFSNVFCWADPERELSVALLTTGKPVVALHVIPLFDLIGEIGKVFPKL
jgi:CubicO group peptidase (beta-lactamase class C family)